MSCGICDRIFLIIMTREVWCGGVQWCTTTHHSPTGDCQTRTVNFSTVNVRARSRGYELWQKHYSVTNDEITSTSTINVTTVHIVRLEGEELVNRKCCKVIWIFLFVWNFCFSRQQLRQQQKEWKKLKLAVIDIFFLTSKISVKYVFVVSEMPCCYKGLFESKHYF